MLDLLRVTRDVRESDENQRDQSEVSSVQNVILTKMLTVSIGSCRYDFKWRPFNPCVAHGGGVV